MLLSKVWNNFNKFEELFLVFLFLFIVIENFNVVIFVIGVIKIIKL